MTDAPRPVSLGHPCVGKRYRIDGKLWQVASVHISGMKLWAWLVNVNRPDEQARYPVEDLPEEA